MDKDGPAFAALPPSRRFRTRRAGATGRQPWAGGNNPFGVSRLVHWKGSMVNVSGRITTRQDVAVFLLVLKNRVLLSVIFCSLTLFDAGGPPEVHHPNPQREARLASGHLAALPTRPLTEQPQSA